MTDNIEERSSLWNFAASTATVGGIGFGIYRAMPDIRAALASSEQTDIGNRLSSELRTLGRFNVSATNRNAFHPEIGENILVGLRDSAAQLIGHNQANIRVKSDIAQAAYESILSGGYATHNQAYMAFQKIRNQTSIHDAFEEAKMNISSFRGSPDVLTTRLGDLGPAGFYTESRLSELYKTSIVPEGLFSGSTIARQPMNMIPADIFKEAEAVKNRLGENVKWGGIYNIEDTLGGQRVSTPMLRGSIAGESINIPLANTGLTYGGENLTARYITRTPYDEFLNLGTYKEQYISTLESAIAANKTSPELKQAVHAANVGIIDRFHNNKHVPESLAIWKMPEQMMTAGGLAKQRINMLEASYAGSRNVTSNFIQDVVNATIHGKASLWPYGSPDAVASGTFSTKNLAEEIYGLLGRFKPVEKRPTQFIREEFGATAKSKMAVPRFNGIFGSYFNRLEPKIQGPGYRNLIYGGLSASDPNAYSAPQLFTLYAKPSEYETGVLAGKLFEEEALISESTSKFMEYERVVQKRINLSPGMPVHQTIQESLMGKKIGELVQFPDTSLGAHRGGFYGIESGTGKEIWGIGTGGAEGRLVGAQMIGDNTASLYIKETHTMGDNWWKFFNEDVKFLGHQVSKNRIASVAEQLGVKQIIAGQEIEQIVNAKMLTKDPAALINQQIAAVSAIASNKINRKDKMITVRRRAIAMEFMENPIKYLGVKDMLNASLSDAVDQVQGNMVSLANTLGFTEQEMGLAFGLMSESNAAKFGIGSAVKSSRAVIGLSGLRLGDFAFEGGSGSRASIEHTGIRLLSMKGNEGLRMAAELGTRIRGSGESVAVNRMLESMIKEQSLFDLIRSKLSPGNLEQLKDISPEQLIKPEGRYVSIGSKLSAFGGSDKIYIPGLSEAEGTMGHFVTDSGQRIPGPVAKHLNELHGLIRSGAGAKETEEAAAQLRNQVAIASEKQAASRGKVIGSKILTAIGQREGQGIAFGLSSSDALRMIEDLSERATTSQQIDLLRQQKEALLSGQEVAGLVWRHPTTGPESAQFIKYKIDKSLSEGMISTPYKRGSLNIGSEDININIGPAVGMKADFDKDILGIAAISDRATYEKVSKQINHSIQDDYNQYLFRHYAIGSMLKENKAGYTSFEDLLRVGARNLTTAKIATPKVNIALQKAKLGIQIARPNDYRPLAELLFHLEESAISGKHGSRESELYERIADAFNNSDENKIESVLRDIGLSDKQISGSIKDKSGKIIHQGKLDVNIKAWSKQLADATKSVGGDIDQMITAAQISKGTVTPRGLAEISESYIRRKTGSMDIAQAVMHSQYFEPTFSENVNRFARRMETKTSLLKSSLSKAKGPAMIGTAIAAGILLASPSISGNMSRQSVSAGRNLMPDDLGPPAGLGMSPPSNAIMVSPKIYDINRIQMASRANIRMSMSDSNARSDEYMKQARILAQNSSVNIRTVDDRENLNPHRLANKIYERI